MIKQIVKRKLDVSHPFLNPIYRTYLVNCQNAQGTIFLMHRVGEIDSNRLPANENMKIDPKELERVIVSYRKAGAVFYSLDQVYELIHERNKIKKTFVCFTFDDGYKDNYTAAYPIFKKYNVPFTIYVSTGFPDYQNFLWWYHLEEYILSKDIIKLNDGCIYQCSTLQEKNDAFLNVRLKVLELKREDFLTSYQSLLGLKSIETQKYVIENSMTWSQIEELSKDPLCTLGGHSITHPAFNMLSDEELRFEVEGGCRILESHTQRPVTHFAYPFGTPHEIGEREHQYISTLNFKTTVMVGGGRTINCGANPLRLSRITLK